MTAGAHDAGGGFSRSAGTNAARGIIVIVAAVAVGLLLMFRGISDNADDTAAGDASTTAAEDGQGDGSETPAAADTSTTLPADETAVESSTTTAVSAPPRDPSEVKVLVLNGTDDSARVAGVAGAGTDLLKPFNYIVLEPKDADVNGPSAVFFAEGFQAEANAVAAVFGVEPSTVVQPLDPTASPVVDTQGANVVVRVGSDGVIKV